MTLKIGELSKSTGCSIETIRYYEKAGLLPEPARTAANYRLYNQQHRERLLFIRHCRSMDITLAEITVLLQLREQPQKNCAEVNTLLDRHIQQVDAHMQQLLQMKQHLLNLREKCTGIRGIEQCGILQGLSDSSYL